MSPRRSARLDNKRVNTYNTSKAKRKKKLTKNLEVTKQLENVAPSNESSADLNEDSDVTDDELSENNDENNEEIASLQSMDSESALEFIRKNYSNPASIICYSSISGLKKIFKTLSEEQIKSVLSKFESYSLMKSSKDNHNYNPFFAHNLRDVFQMDCLQLKELAAENDGFSHLLCVLDVFSKWLWCQPMKSTKGEECTSALKSIFQDMKVLPECIVCDRGTEFKNHFMMQMLKSLNIKLIFSQSSFKASGVERAQYSIERLIFSHITAHESLNYIGVLQKLIRRYNKTKHSFTGFSPLEVENSDQKQDIVLLKFGERYRKLKKREPKFSPGDTVRILLFKSPFHRGYNIQRSYERFVVHKLIKYKTPLYILRDEQERIIAGLFNEFELVKVNLSRYRVIVKDKKIVKNKKWLKLHYKGYSDDLDEWKLDDGKEIVGLSDEQQI